MRTVKVWWVNTKSGFAGDVLISKLAATTQEDAKKIALKIFKKYFNVTIDDLVVGELAVITKA
jgi:hypothetical protein